MSSASSQDAFECAHTCPLEIGSLRMNANTRSEHCERVGHTTPSNGTRELVVTTSASCVQLGVQEVTVSRENEAARQQRHGH